MITSLMIMPDYCRYLPVMISRRSKRVFIYLGLFFCLLFIRYQYSVFPSSRIRFVSEELVKVEPDECIKTRKFDTGQPESAGQTLNWSW